jgi:hypothetical protein
MLAGDARWKTYQPKAAFHQSDAVGFRGEKTFEQPLIASQPGVTGIPALAFSFFDPGTHRFETVHSAPLTVTVSPPAADSTPPAPALANAVGANGEDAHGLRPDHAEMSARVDSLTPLYFQPRFFAVPSALALLFGGAWVALRRRDRNAGDLQRARERLRLQLTQASLAEMAAASARADASSFFNAARSALRQSLGAHWQMSPEQIGSAEVDARIEGADREAILQIFSLADEANYSGGPLRAADFDRWTQLVRRQIVSQVPT